jgi:phage-related protein
LRQSGPNKNLMDQFTSLYDKSHSFNDLLAKGGPAAQNYTAALANMMGGATGLNTALMLSGNNAGVFQANVAKIQDAADKSGTSVDNWSTIQGTFNQKMASAKTAVQNTAISLGTALLPAVTSLLQAVQHILVPIAAWTSSHRGLTEAIFGTLGGLAATVIAVALAAKAFKAAKGAIDDVGKVLGGVKKAFTAIPWSSMGSSASSAFDTVRLKAMYAWDGIKSGAGTAKKFATDAFDTLRLQGMAAWDAVKSGASSAASAVADFGTKIGSAVAQGASTAWDTISSGLSTVATNAKAAAVAALDFSKGLLTSAASALRAAGAWMLDKVQLIATTVAEKAATAAQWLLNAAMSLSPLQMIIIAIAALVAAFVYLWNHSKAFRDFWIGLWHDIQQIVSDVVDWIKTHWQLLIEIVLGPLGVIIVEVVKHWDQIKQIFTDAVHAIESILNWFGSLPGKFGQWLGQMGDTIKQKIENAILFFANLQTKILGLLKDAGTWLVNVGEDIIRGLGQGIDNMVGWLEDKAKNIGGTVVNTLKSWLHIGSPSKLMADEIGAQIPAGIAQGIIGNLGAISAAAHMAGQVTVTAAQGGVGSSGLAAPAPLPGAAAVGGAPQMVFDLRGAFVSDDQALRNLVNKVGGVVAKQMFAQGGYKLQTM